MDEKSIHAGHRQRLKQRYLSGGLDSFDDVNVLELLLTFGTPRRDCNEAAHALLAQFGSLSGVLEAPVEALSKIPGVSEHAAILLHLVTDVCRRHLIDRAKMNDVLTTVDACGNYLVPFFYGLRNEAVYLLSLDAKCKVLACHLIGDGAVNSANVPIRKIVEKALAVNATSVILAHNHPSGIAVPSRDDIAATEKLRAALDAVGIVLVDHIIVADEDFVSLSQSGYGRSSQYGSF